MEDMNNGIVENWNSVVKKHDLVYHLGDFAMGGKNKSEEMLDYLNKLNGRIRLIVGNHDSYILDKGLVERFEWVRYYYELNYSSPKYGKRRFVLMHYPLYTWNGKGKLSGNGNCRSIMLHGHCHGNINKENEKVARMDVGIDSVGYFPISIESVIENIDSKKYD